MTARNYCPAGDCDHLTKADKREAHGTPEAFETEVRKVEAEGLITPEEAAATIQRYRTEYEAAPESRTTQG